MSDSYFLNGFRNTVNRSVLTPPKVHEPPKIPHTPPNFNGKGKLAMALAGLSLLAASSVLSAKQYRESQIDKAQQTFQETFMRDDISKEETIEMLERYKEIKKIPDKEEYLKAMFNEAKRNFGFENADIDLYLNEGKIHGNYQILGNTNSLCGFIEITKTQTRDKAADSIHHEMRHMKQVYLGFNANPEQYVRNILISQLKSKGKDEEFIKRVMTPNYIKDNIEGIKQYMKIDNPSLNNIPEKDRPFALQLLNEGKNYISSEADHEGYMNTLEERDAYNIGQKMGKLIRDLR